MTHKFYFIGTNWTVGAWYFRNRYYCRPCQWVWKGKRTR